MLNTEQVHFAYKRSPILRGATLRASAGRVTALVGPNGSGKSTLLRCIAGSLHPGSGKVSWAGRNLINIHAHERAKLIAFVPQENPAPFAFTVAELVGLGAAASTQNVSRETNYTLVNEKAERCRRALAAVDLVSYENRNLLSLSGGEKQRASIARALAQETPCLLLDEPTAHLDIRHATDVLSATRHIAHTRNAAVLIVLHDLNFAASWADEIAVMDAGRVVAQDETATILAGNTLETVYRVQFERVTGQDGRLRLLAPSASKLSTIAPS